MTKSVKQHEDLYIHIPRTWYFPVLLLCGFVFISLLIFSLDSSMMKNVIEEAINIKDFDLLSKLTIVIVIGTIIAVLTNRIMKFLVCLFLGSIAGLFLGSIFFSLFFILFAGLVVGPGEDN